MFGGFVGDDGCHGVEIADLGEVRGADLSVIHSNNDFLARPTKDYESPGRWPDPER